MALRREQQSVAQQIVDIIRDLGLRPGDAMPTELDLIERLQVSRNTVREAVRELRAWGIVDIRHGHGTFVAPPSLQALAPSLVFRALVAGPQGLESLYNLARVREMLESSAVREVIGRIEPDREQLLVLCELIADPSESAQADQQFHRLLYSRLPNPLIGQLIDVFWDAYHEAHGLLVDPSQYEDDADEAQRHRRIVLAVDDGDADEAVAAMKAHFDGIYRRLEASGLVLPE